LSKTTTEKKLKVSNLTKDWTPEDWQRFSQWWSERNFNEFNELVAIYMPEGRSLKKGDRMKGMHIKKRVYDRLTAEDLRGG